MLELLGEEKQSRKPGLRAVCIKGTQWAVTSMVFGWFKASATGSKRSPWILVPASPLIHPPSWPSDRASTMHSLDLPSGIATLCVCLTALPYMVYAIPLRQFYRYGRSAGDAVLRRNDDGVSPPIPLGSSGFQYYRNLHSSIFVSLVSSCNRLRGRALIL